MAGAISFRKGEHSDAREFAELDGLCFPPRTAFGIETFRYHLRDPRSANIVAVLDDGSIAGFAVGRVYRGDEAHIVTLDVHPDHRRVGIGGELIDRLEKNLVGLGAKLIALQVAVGNEPAIALYRKSGYAVLRILRDYYLDIQSPAGRDAFLMVKFL